MYETQSNTFNSERFTAAPILYLILWNPMMLKDLFWSHKLHCDDISLNIFGVLTCILTLLRCSFKVIHALNYIIWLTCLGNGLIHFSVTVSTIIFKSSFAYSPTLSDYRHFTFKFLSLSIITFHLLRLQRHQIYFSRNKPIPSSLIHQ